MSGNKILCIRLVKTTIARNASPLTYRLRDDCPLFILFIPAAVVYTFVHPYGNFQVLIIILLSYRYHGAV